LGDASLTDWATLRSALCARAVPPKLKKRLAAKKALPTTVAKCVVSGLRLTFLSASVGSRLPMFVLRENLGRFYARDSQRRRGPISCKFFGKRAPEWL